jgi:luciferase family oxidoreductase group 1
LGRRAPRDGSVRRLGAGGLARPVKVAEAFRVLHALYPGRIDLGIGRAPGGTPLETLALRRERGRRPFPDDFPEQVVELLAFLGAGFEPDHPFGRIEVSPAGEGGPDVWMLGSSMWSSAAAAQLGLPYAFAHFIDPTPTRHAVSNYRENFTSLHPHAEPRVILALGAICADTEAEARRLAQSLRLFRKLLLDGGRIGPIATPEEAIERLGCESSYATDRRSEWPRVVVGATEHVRDELVHIAAELHVDELMLVTVVHDHSERVRSYELLAEAFGLEPRATAAGHAATGGTV